MTFFRWSRVKDTNNTADSTCPFPEGQSPSSLNDGSRGQMAALAKWRDDISGAILTGGTSAAYTVSSYQGFDTLASLHNQMIGFTPHTSNVDTVLLNVDGLGLKPLRGAPGVELPKGTLIQGTPYIAVYNNTDGVFYLRASYASPFNIPFLGGVEYWDTVAPSSAFIFPVGQALSRTVYAAAWAKWGTRFGAGDGSTTFNAPDKRGRVSAMIEAAASRLTPTYFGGDSTQIGAVGGAENISLSSGNLPNIAPTFTGSAGTVSVNSQGGVISGTIFSNSTNMTVGGGSFFATLSQNSASSTSVNSTGSFVPSGTVSGFGGNIPHNNTQPSIVCNYIIRVL